jgi:hypothetical protein
VSLPTSCDTDINEPEDSEGRSEPERGLLSTEIWVTQFQEHADEWNSDREECIFNLGYLVLNSIPDYEPLSKFLTKTKVRSTQVQLLYHDQACALPGF